MPEQAEVVKRNYKEYLDGKSCNKFAKGLERDGILTGFNKKKWYESTVIKILKNEKFMGDALLQKTYTVDFLTKKRVINKGHVPQYYVEDSHPAIISKEMYAAVQAEFTRRSNMRGYSQEGLSPACCQILWSEDWGKHRVHALVYYLIILAAFEYDAIEIDYWASFL